MSLFEKTMKLLDHANGHSSWSYLDDAVGVPPVQYAVDKSPPYAICQECGVSSQSLRLEGKWAPARCANFTCWNISCKTSHWYYCMDCNKRLSRSAAKYHFLRSLNHKSEAMSAKEDSNGNLKNDTEDAMSEDAMSVDLQVEESAATNGDIQSEQRGNANDDGVECMFVADLSREETQPPQDENMVYPRVWVDHNNDWMIELVNDQDRASVEAVSESFNGSSNNMKYYWVAEHSSPTGCWGGGLCFLISRTFQGTEFIESKALASVGESMWQFRSFTQFHQMSAKQKRRQATLLGALAKSPFFKTTSMLLGYTAMNRHYGLGGKGSIWNSLPIPTVQDLYGVAYTNPLEALRFAMANGMPVEEFYAKENEESLRSESVFFVGECNAAYKVWQKVKKSANFDDGPVVIICGSVWRDGCGTSRVKQNRKSLVAMTMNFGAQKHKINSTDNTFLIALGLKSQKEGWSAVEYRYLKDMKIFRDPSKPVKFYHGQLKRFVSVYFEELVYLEDKPERADVTYTLNAGNFHRRFGKAWKLERFEFDRRGIEKFLQRQKDGKEDAEIRWGWSEEYVDCHQGANAAKLPACWSCRRRNLVKLGVDLQDNDSSIDSDNSTEANIFFPGSMCCACANWTMDSTTSAMLSYTLPEKYPRTLLPDCPVDPPEGREVGNGSNIQQGRDLTFEMMKQAGRFAWYHCSRAEKQGRWTKAECKDYLNTCCFKASLVDSLYKEATKARRGDYGIAVDYTSPTNIGGFYFPAPWSLGDIKKHIEVPMHGLFLGCVSSMQTLNDVFLKRSGLAKMNAFKKAMQPLLTDIKALHLEWMHVQKFSAREEQLTTGSWVSEDYMGWERLSPIAYAWLHGDETKAKRHGADNISRMIIAFHALAARVMTHGGIDCDILDEIDLYAKEFLSAAHEVDMLTRYTDIPQKEHWWKKPNMLGLLNLAEQIEELGPSVLWWDGSGKGEKFIQVLKPLVPTGIRESVPYFMVRVQEKVYKLRCIEYIERNFDGDESNPVDLSSFVMDTNEAQSLEVEMQRGDFSDGDLEFDVLRSDGGDAADLSDDTSDSSFEDNSADDDSDDDEDSQNSSFVTDEALDAVHNPAIYCSWEDELMTKTRTIYLYKNEALLEHEANHLKPLSGIVVLAETLPGLLSYELRVVVRLPHSSFGWCRVSFDDENGVFFKGMWYAEVTLSSVTKVGCPQTIQGIQSISKMAAIAVPLRYAIGENEENSMKYCVITNWWKERQGDGQYLLPVLDNFLYEI